MYKEGSGLYFVMSFWKFFLDRIGIVLFNLGSLLFIILLESAFKVQGEVILVTFLVSFLVFVISFGWDFLRKRGFYNSLRSNIEALDKKYLVIEMLSKPSCYEEELVYEALYEINKSMADNVNLYKNDMDEFRDYAMMWIHEVKIPISSLVLMVHNHRDRFSLQYIRQIRRLDSYIDQILYFIRSNYTNEDFVFKGVSLNMVVGEVALRNKDDLLENGIEFISDVRGDVYTDSKWLIFILNQIVNNCIKYRKGDENSYIRIWSEVDDSGNVVLSIRDNGIGISKGDIGNVFRKSFTGSNGRWMAKSTGMGLYICRKLCLKLGHRIEIASEEGEYTVVRILFGKNGLYHPSD